MDTLAQNLDWKQPGWLDSVAVGMSLLCAVHCLVTPALLVLLPILATTFWVHQDFHLWMLLLVLPTTGLAVFLGCRKHKDIGVLCFAASGLFVLTGVALLGSFPVDGAASSGACAHCVASTGSVWSDPITWTNTLGGALLICAHVRNFRLCRKQACHHECSCAP